MSKKLMSLTLWGCGVALLLAPLPTQADFLIEFLDGRTVTVGHYVEEGTWIKVYTPQGSIGFRKAEVKRILAVDTNGEGIPLETVSLHGPITTESAASPTQPGEKNATGEKGSATSKAGEKAAGKEELVDREKLNDQYQGVAQNLQSVWDKHLEDVRQGASQEVLEENRRKMNELNLHRHDLIKTARQGKEEELPDWAR